MAKKQTPAGPDRGTRTTRKEYLLARKQEQQARQVRLVVLAVGGLLALIFAVAFVNEYVLAPARPVVTVDGEEVSLGDWQARVRYQRASLVLLLEQQLESFVDPEAEDREAAEAQAIGFIQQFMGQQINALVGDPEALGEFVLERMIEDIVVRHEAERRGITVTEADVDAAIEEQFNFFDGLPPTPRPTSTATVMPTPSLTPIVAGDVVPPTLAPTNTPGPTNTPRPTPTAVSRESFETLSSEELADFRALGVDEATYRAAIREQIYRERLLETLAAEADLPEEAEHVSFFVIEAGDPAEANELLDEISAVGYEVVWNRLRSEAAAPPPADGQAPTATATAREQLWRTLDDLESIFPPEVIGTLAELGVGENSDVVFAASEALVPPAEGEEPPDSVPGTFYLLQMTGREVRPLSESAINQLEVDEFDIWLDQALLEAEILRTEFWRNRVPASPILDPKFLQQPPPAAPTDIPFVAPEQ